jgi:excisionase family DNA binding protein
MESRIRRRAARCERITTGQPFGNQRSSRLNKEGTMDKYLTVPETAEYLNTSERFVRRLIAERRIAFHHVGRHIRLSMTDLDTWLATSRVEPLDANAIMGELRGVA